MIYDIIYNFSLPWPTLWRAAICAQYLEATLDSKLPVFLHVAAKNAVINHTVLTASSQSLTQYLIHYHIEFPGGSL